MKKVIFMMLLILIALPLTIKAQHTSRQQKGTLTLVTGQIPPILQQKAEVNITFDFSQVKDKDGNSLDVLLKRLKWKKDDYQNKTKEGVSYFLDKWNNVSDGCTIVYGDNAKYHIEVIPLIYDFTKSIFGTNYMSGSIRIYEIPSNTMVCDLAFRDHYGTKTMDVERGKSVKWMLNDLAEELYFVLLNPSQIQSSKGGDNSVIKF